MLSNPKLPIENLVGIHFSNYPCCKVSKLQHGYGRHGRHSIPDRRNERSRSHIPGKLGGARRRRPPPRRVSLSELWKGSALRRLSDQRFAQPVSIGRLGLGPQPRPVLLVTISLTRPESG